MVWSFRKLLERAGIPAAVFFVAWTIRDLGRRGPDETVFDVILPIGIIIVVLWIATAVFLWLVSRACRSAARCGK